MASPLIESQADGEGREKEPAPEMEELPAGCCGTGPCGGLVEAFSLFWIVPEYWRICAYSFCSAAGCCLPSIYVLGPLSSQVWKENTATYSNWTNAAGFLVAIIGAPQFGKWSDGRPRKTGVIICACATASRYVPFILLALEIFPDDPAGKATAIWTFVGLTIVTSPFVAQLSGSPVTWAWMTDILPPEHRETGFTMVSAICSFGVWITGTICSALSSAFGFGQNMFLWVGQVFLLGTLILVFTAPKMPAKVSAEERGPSKTLWQQLISPLHLVARKRSLRLICGLAGMVTLPDIAVTYTAYPIVLVILGIDGEGHEAEQLSLSNWFSNFPNIFMLPLYAVMGVCAKRFGPARMLSVWVPIACVCFATPGLLQWTGPSPPVEVLAGFMMITPLTIFPPLQALVTCLVPAARIGEGMGAIAACKNFASLVAPLVMSLVTATLPHDLYWTIFPGAAAVMFAGAVPFACMLKNRVTQDVEVTWSVWSSVAMSAAERRSHAASTMAGSRAGDPVVSNRGDAGT